MTFRLGHISVNDEITKYCVCPTIALLRAQSLILDKPDGYTAATVVVVHVHSAGIEVKVPRVVGVFGRRRPIVAVGPHVVDTSVAIAVARGGQHVEQTLALCAAQGSPCAGLWRTDPL